MSEALTQDLAAGDLPAAPDLPPGILDDLPDPFDRLADALQGGLRPDPALTVSEWADAHRILAGASSAEPGRYRTSRAPFLREIMDSLSPHSPVQRVVFMKGAQIGGSEAGNNLLGYVIDCAPGPIMVVQPTVETAKRFSKQRVDPLIESTPSLRDKVRPARARDSGNTILQKDFPGGTLVLTGANSAVGLRSMPARYLFLDEVDAYDADVEGEGSPIAIAEQRTKTYGWRKKLFLVSTPKIKGSSAIEREYEASDQRRYFVPCPHCREMQWLKMPRLRWDQGKPETAAYYCEACGVAINESHKTAMLAAGEWRPTATLTTPSCRGYHVSSLYSPVGWSSWADIAASFDAAKGDVAALKSFVNTVLGETWQERGDAPEWQRLFERAEPAQRGVVPARAVVLTAGADNQAAPARVEMAVWAWGPGLESWLVDVFVFEGSPAEAGPWDAFAEVMNRDWPVEGGGTMRISRAGVDTQGSAAAAVYGHLRRLRDPRILPMRGVDTFAKSVPVSGPTLVDVTEGGRKLKRGLKLWNVAVSMFKSELYRRLWLTRADDGSFPKGWVHIPDWVEPEHIKQLVAEHLVGVKNKKRGTERLEWQPLRPRNEQLDMAVYARAALAVMGADRGGESFWRHLSRDRDRLEVERIPDVVQSAPAAPLPAPAATPSPPPRLPPPPAPAPRPRRFTSSYMS